MAEDSEIQALLAEIASMADPLTSGAGMPISMPQPAAARSVAKRKTKGGHTRPKRAVPQTSAATETTMEAAHQSPTEQTSLLYDASVSNRSDNLSLDTIITAACQFYYDDIAINQVKDGSIFVSCAPNHNSQIISLITEIRRHHHTHLFRNLLRNRLLTHISNSTSPAEMHNHELMNIIIETIDSS